MRGNLKNEYGQYLFERNRQGSNKASSYIKALELLADILKQPSSLSQSKIDFWSIDSLDDIEVLYQLALKHQKDKNSDFQNPDFPPSYGRNGYFSAALRSYGEFLTYYQYEKRLLPLIDKIDDELKIMDLIESTDIKNTHFISDQDVVPEGKGKDVLREVKTRLNQRVFRKMIIKNYRISCSVSGLTIPEVLRASHIIPWAEDEKNRLNPCNGLCLSATYDAAFDRHLISFDEDYRMIFSSSLKEYHSNEAFQKYFKCYEGNQLFLPDRFLPDQEFLEKHRKQLA